MVKLNPHVFMVNTASKALDYQNERPHIEIEEIMKHIILSLGSETKPDLKILGIAAANEVLKMKRAFVNISNK